LPDGVTDICGPGDTGRTVTRFSRPRRTRSAARKLRKPRIPRPAYRKLTQYAMQFADQLKKDGVLSPHIRSDLRAFREDLLLAVKRQFKLKAGRPGDPLIDKACELVRVRARDACPDPLAGRKMAIPLSQLDEPEYAFAQRSRGILVYVSCSQDGK
jgi:hypothetical protein